MKMSDKRGKKPACFGSIGKQKTQKKKTHCTHICEWRILCRRENEKKEDKKKY